MTAGESGEPPGSVLFCFGFQSEEWILVSVGQVKKENTTPVGTSKVREMIPSRKTEGSESLSKREVLVKKGTC